MQGEYEAREENMMQYCDMAKSLTRRFAKVLLERVLRLQNEEADRLARIASSGEPDQRVPLEVLDSPSILNPEVDQTEHEDE